MNYDLKIIKNKYGEKMMHLCRELFPTILEEEGLLSSLLLDNFNPSRHLYDDIVASKNVDGFKNYIYGLIDAEKKYFKTTLTPKELMKSVGYDLYECRTEEDIMVFRKYYKQGEELCTFTQGDRLNRCHVFFAVKENVDQIRRENFKNPNREDLYGTSVISIQFTKGGINTLSIKNRYNHRVSNPDNTYFNNLENIVPGLTDSFEREYNFKIDQNDEKFELPGYVKARDGRYYKYNYEINNIYYCPDNIIIDNFEVIKYKEEKYIVLDYFVLDLVNKEIYAYDWSITDSFIDGITNIDKISITKDKDAENKKIEIQTKDNNLILIEIDKQNRIISYENKKLTSVEDNFLIYNKTIIELNLPSLRECGKRFLYDNKNLTELNLPELEKCGELFLYWNLDLKKLNLSKLTYCGDYFLNNNKNLTELNLSKLTKCGRYFLPNNKSLTELNLPELEECGECFLYSNLDLKELNLSKLTYCGDYFLRNNRRLKKLNLPELEECGEIFLESNLDLEELNLRELKECGKRFLYDNKNLKELNLPKLEKCGESFLYWNNSLVELNVPNLKEAGDGFLSRNTNIDKEEILKYCKKIDYVDIRYIFYNTIRKINKVNKSTKAVINSFINKDKKEEKNKNEIRIG